MLVSSFFGLCQSSPKNTELGLEIEEEDKFHIQLTLWLGMGRGSHQDRRHGEGSELHLASGVLKGLDLSSVSSLESD